LKTSQIIFLEGNTQYTNMNTNESSYCEMGPVKQNPIREL